MKKYYTILNHTSIDKANSFILYTSSKTFILSNMNLTLRQLQVFVAIATHRTVTLASKKLHLSQPAVSMALSDLEHQLGEQLFDRSKKRLYLNDRGRVLLPMSMDLLNRAREIEESFLGKGQELQSLLRIGASTTIGNYLFPNILKDILQKFPRIRVDLQIGNTRDIIERLLNFEIDAGFIEGLCFHQDIETIPWKKDRLVFFAAPDHPLTKHADLSLADLKQARWILREQGSGTRVIFENAVIQELGELDIFLQLGSTEAIKNAVSVGLGIACLSEFVLQKEFKHQELVPLKTSAITLQRTLYQLLLKDKYQGSALKQFLGLVMPKKLS